MNRNNEDIDEDIDLDNLDRIGPAGEENIILLGKIFIFGTYIIVGTLLLLTAANSFGWLPESWSHIFYKMIFVAPTT